jgi:hypothetical protein
MVANILLSLWLLNQYLYDQYFRGYINTLIAPLLPYLVLTIGIGGGSSLGYALLKRKPSGAKLAERLQKAKLLKTSPLMNGPGSSIQAKNVPVGAPPGPVSRHTAYAVPSLSKTASSPAQKPAPPTSWSMSKQPTMGPSSQKTGAAEPAKPALAPSISSKAMQPQTVTAPTPFSEAPKQGQLDRGVESSLTRPAPAFSSFSEELKRTPPVTTGPTEKSTSPYSNLYSDSSSIPSQNFQGQPSSQATDRAPRPPPIFQPTKWQPPDSNKPGQWNDPVPHQGYTPAQKWAPPAVSPISNPRPPPSMNPPGRPGQLAPGKPLYPAQQGAPRPLAYPGSMRPSASSVPGPFRPEVRPPQALGGPSRPDPSSQRLTPLPSPPVSEKKDAGASPTFQTSQTEFPPSTLSETQSQNESSGSSSSGEMDWDTALDTILKTLRKDKVGDKP